MHKKRWFFLQFLRGKKPFLKGNDHLVWRKFDLLSSERIFQTNSYLTVRATEILSWSYLHKWQATWNLITPLIKKKIPIWWFIEWGKTTCCHLGSLLYTRYSPLLRLRPLSLPPSYTTISIEKILHYIWASYDKKVNKTIQQKHSRTAEKKVLASFSGRDICTFGHSLLVNSNLHERCPINLLRSQHGTFLQNERKTGNITNIFLASGL